MRVTLKVATVVLATALMILPRSAAAQALPTAPRVISWTTDMMALEAGDVITILIDELTLASADRDQSAENARGRDVALRAGTGSGTPMGGSLRTGNESSDRTRGESSRRERFQAELSAQIVEILPNGVARIEGKKKLQIDDHEQEVTVRGFVRTQDISASNTVESWRIAQAELLYASNGKLGESGGGIWGKILGMIIP